jgi:hypothetical protein
MLGGFVVAVVVCNESSDTLRAEPLDHHVCGLGGVALSLVGDTFALAHSRTSSSDASTPLATGSDVLVRKQMDYWCAFSMLVARRSRRNASVPERPTEKNSEMPSELEAGTLPARTAPSDMSRCSWCVPTSTFGGS